MNPAQDALYSVHQVQAERRGQAALPFEQFSARLHETYETDLTKLLTPPSGGEANTHAEREIRFPLGRLCVTAEAANLVPLPELLQAVKRHAAGDWGTYDHANWVKNDVALEQGGRLLSTYQASTGQKFWITTEPDRTATTVLLPEEF